MLVFRMLFFTSILIDTTACNVHHLSDSSSQERRECAPWFHCSIWVENALTCHKLWEHVVAGLLSKSKSQCELGTPARGSESSDRTHVLARCRAKIQLWHCHGQFWPVHFGGCWNGQKRSSVHLSCWHCACLYSTKKGSPFELLMQSSITHCAIQAQSCQWHKVAA